MSTAIVVAAISAILIFGLSPFGVSLSLRAVGAVEQRQSAVTFTKDVAPIVFTHCSVCHQPGGAAPFSLLSGGDFRLRRRQLATVVRTRSMPPWRAAAGHWKFAGERRLTDEQIELIVRWLESGAVEGDPSDLPPLPPPPDRWQLGEPDLIITMSEPYTLPADGGEVFRNFVLPVSIPETRYVKAWEFRPDNAKVVHHATMHLDAKRSSRHLDDQDPAPGFEGLVPFSVRDPAGYFLGWTPGQQPFVAAPENAWALEQDSDLIVMMHLKPSGKRETVRASLGLYFSKTPPSHLPLTLRLGSQAIDIPANSRDYRIDDSLTLPVDVDVLTVYPHAHYLAREITAAATFPDGATESLLQIKDWDFKWQDVYRYLEPVFLPAGTTIHAQFVYDNSVENPRNPHRPPRRVTFGKHSSDEMGDLWVQVVPRNAADLAALTTAVVQKTRPETIRGLEMILRTEPDNRALHDSAALLYDEEGDLQNELRHFRESLRTCGDCASAQYNVGTALLKAGRSLEASDYLSRALTLDPEYQAARTNLGVALQQAGRLEEAVGHYRKAVRAAAERCGRPL